MEKLVLAQTDQYFAKFKTDIQRKAIELGFDEKDKMNELLEFIFEYEKIKFEKHVFSKKTKTGGSAEEATNKAPPVPEEEQCMAVRKQGGVRCTRKKTKGQMYCGTHCGKNGVLKTDLHASVLACSNGQESQETTGATNAKKASKMLEVVAHEIQGIIYYIDKEMNVYNTEDIFKNVNNPRVIAKAVQLGQNLFSIPSLGL
jgi:hypothetical protein